MAEMDKMLKQMQKFREQMEELQEQLAIKEVSHSAGGGMVTAVVNGRQELVDLKIDPQAIDPNDPEILEDMVIAAVNGAIKEAFEMARQEMSKLTGGLSGMPGIGELM